MVPHNRHLLTADEKYSDVVVLTRGYFEQCLDDGADQVVKKVVELWLPEEPMGSYRSPNIGVCEVVEFGVIE